MSLRVQVLELALSQHDRLGAIGPSLDTGCVDA